MTTTTNGGAPDCLICTITVDRTRDALRTPAGIAVDEHARQVRADLDRAVAEAATLRAERDTLQRIADERKVAWRRALADAVRLRDAVGPLVEAMDRYHLAPFAVGGGDDALRVSPAERAAIDDAERALGRARAALTLDAPADLAREEERETCPVNGLTLETWARGVYIHDAVEPSFISEVEMRRVVETLAWLVADRERTHRRIGLVADVALADDEKVTR